jgi:hypothetical protein
MRSYSPGGRFDKDFELNDVKNGIVSELQNSVGTTVQWWLYDSADTQVDPIYDVGSIGEGRQWTGPITVPVVRAVLKQGTTMQSDQGFYNTDSLHLLLDANVIQKVIPGVLDNPDPEDRGRIVFKNEVFRPNLSQQAGIIGDKYSLLVVDCLQVMPDEMVNDSQFAAYSSNVPDTYDN